MSTSIQNSETAHGLYVLYRALPDETQQFFLQELLQKQANKLEDLALYQACKQAKDEDEFLTDNEKNDFLNSLLT